MLWAGHTVPPKRLGLPRLLMLCYRLNLMFTIAAVATNVCALPVGTILDRYGPRVCGIVGSVLIAIGSILMATAASAPFDAYIAGYFFLALGGPFIYISSFQLSNCFPLRSGLILALLTGSFDTSSAIFLIYRLIYQGSNGWFTLQRFFIVYLIVPIFILVVQFTLMPKESYKTVGEIVAEAEDPDGIPVPASEATDERHRNEYIAEQAKLRRESVLSEITPLLGGQNGEARERKKEAKKRHISGVWGALHGRPAWRQIRTWWFVLMTAFVVIQMTRINYFVATVRSQYDYLLGAKAAARINHAFDVALPAGGVVSVPFIGLVLDNLSTAACLAALVGSATLIGVLGVIAAEPAAYANIMLFVLYRPFYYTAVSDYAAKVFGFQTFGKVYGLIICVAGLFNFSQSGLDALSHQVFRDDPVPVNLILLAVVVLVGTAVTLYVWRQSKRLERDFLEEAEEAEERLIPNGAEGPSNGIFREDWARG